MGGPAPSAVALELLLERQYSSDCRGRGKVAVWLRASCFRPRCGPCRGQQVPLALVWSHRHRDCAGGPASSAVALELLLEPDFYAACGKEESLCPPGLGNGLRSS